MTNRDFDEWLSKFRPSISSYDYYIDFDKVVRNVEEIKVELNILNSLIGSKNIEEDFEKIVSKYPETLQCVPLLLAVRGYEIYAQDEDGAFLYNFKNMNYDVEQYKVFMRKTGLFDMIANHLVNNLVDYALGIETGLDSNGRKNRGGHQMEDLVEKYIRAAGFKKDVNYFKEMYLKDIEQKWDIDLSALSNQGKAAKRFDFVIKTDNQIYGIETNFYGGGGSKLNETARSYKMLSQEADTIDRFTFVWITDGIGWKSAKGNLRETFEVMGSMSDIYEEKGRTECEFIRRKIAQKIEQGLGRSVRGEKDYCCIFIIGADLVKFIMSSETRNYFSPQTRKQIEIGLSIVEMSDDGSEKKESYLMDLIKQSVLRDDGWKEYYKSEMEKVESDKTISNQAMLIMEKQSEQFFINSKYEESALIIQNFLDSEKLREEDKGWYLQEIARRKYMISRIEADKFQSAAFEKNRQLLKPAREIVYQPFSGINASRANNIQKIFQKYETYDELILQVNDVLDNLSFGVQAEKFERAMDCIGKLLGFDCQRPDKMIRKGPDNLWKIGHDKYIMIECKSEVKDSRRYIYKSEVGQMENHCGWFEEVYHDASVLRIIAIVTNNVAPDANFSHKVVILRKKNLRKLKSNIKKFVQEFKNYDIKHITESVIDSALNKNFLSEQNIWEDYVEELRRE